MQCLGAAHKPTVRRAEVGTENKSRLPRSGKTSQVTLNTDNVELAPDWLEAFDASLGLGDFTFGKASMEHQKKQIQRKQPAKKSQALFVTSPVL